MQLKNALILKHPINEALDKLYANDMIIINAGLTMIPTTMKSLV